MLDRKSIAAVLAASAFLSALAVSSQSYWIDEALSLIVAQASTPAESWKFMQAVSGSTLQMPLYQIYLYAWHKVFGGGEWTMRASNIPWFLLGQAAFLFFLRTRPRLALAACLLAAVSPMLWAYLDETRPYIMQYSAACWLVAALTESCRRPARGMPPLNTAQSAALCGAFCVLFGSSLLGAVWALCFAAALLSLHVWDSPLPKGAGIRVIVFSAAAMTLALAAYYLSTWGDAKRGYHLAGASALSIPLVAFEMLGFMGFGPGKAAMRADPVNSLVGVLPWLAPLGIVFLGLTVVCIQSIHPRLLDRRAMVSWLLALALPAAVILCALYFQGHRPLPRHFIPALPAILLAVATVMNSALARKPCFGRALAIALPVLWLASSINLRGQPVHAKENYRDAAAIATAALRENKEVWWAADQAAAHVYGTPISLERIPGCAWGIGAKSWDEVCYKFPPDLIVLSRPDVYDPQGAVARYTRENSFAPALNLTGIVVFERRAPSPRGR